jgi:hypothetical protein
MRHQASDDPIFVSAFFQLSIQFCADKRAWRCFGYHDVIFAWLKIVMKFRKMTAFGDSPSPTNPAVLLIILHCYFC